MRNCPYYKWKLEEFINYYLNVVLKCRKLTLTPKKLLGILYSPFRPSSFDSLLERIWEEGAMNTIRCIKVKK